MSWSDGKNAIVQVYLYNNSDVYTQYDVTNWEICHAAKMLQIQTTDGELITFPMYTLKFFKIKKK